MEGVMRAISALEKLTLTKEALEEEYDDGTRLGRLVNDIRKAATSNKLRDRCKRLIQKWKNQFVGAKGKSNPAEVSSPTTSQQNQNSASTQSPKVSPPVSKPPIKKGGTPVDQTKSENRKRRKPDSPAIPPDIQQPSKKQSVDKDSRKGISDSLKDSYKGSTEKKGPEVSSKDDNSATRNVSPKAGKAKSVRGREASKEKKLYKQVVQSSAIKAADENDTWQSGTKLKESKKRKSPKVAKRNFISKGNGSTSSSPTTYVQSEETQDSFVASPVSFFDEASQSPVSFSLQDDSVINSRAESSIFDITAATEGSIVDELTVSSVPDSPADSVHYKETLDSGESSQHSNDSNKMSEIVEDVRTLGDEDSLNEEDERFLKKEISEDDIRRLHLEHWEGVNGNYNSNRDWSSWNECVVRDSGGGNSLHILPYVCID
ncbi:Mediator of RNA polymerase II transcription subunit 26 [Holothuria leucospilota]|uniref:Mediator of RNA polymerase II transcription subunit 26 n=1 Tax=Holothuria leucospilota TaxID=206669 RepID=A0A9Q1C8L5_HOLLE|nr:Mediator of RNA polymerase II transcription subunit 26 [Holothuria leucospilota]